MHRHILIPTDRLGAVSECNRIWHGSSEVGQCQSHGSDRVAAVYTFAVEPDMITDTRETLREAHGDPC